MTFLQEGKKGLLFPMKMRFQLKLNSFKENEMIIPPGTTDKVADRSVDDVDEIVHDPLDVIQESVSLLSGNQVVQRSG